MLWNTQTQTDVNKTIDFQCHTSAQTEGNQLSLCHSDQADRLKGTSYHLDIQIKQTDRREQTYRLSMSLEYAD